MLPDSQLHKHSKWIFHQGTNSTQGHAMHYLGDRVRETTTGEHLWYKGRNHLKPLNNIFDLHIGPT